MSAFDGDVLQNVCIKGGGEKRGAEKQKRRDQCIAAALAVRGVEHGGAALPVQQLGEIACRAIQTEPARALYIGMDRWART